MDEREHREPFANGGGVEPNAQLRGIVPRNVLHALRHVPSRALRRTPLCMRAWLIERGTTPSLANVWIAVSIRQTRAA